MATKASLVESVYQRIKAEVCSGGLLPGQRVDIASMCDRYGASKSPVRNALNRLVGEGLLEIHAHDGFYRPRVTEKTVRDLYGLSEGLLMMVLDQALGAQGGDDVLPPVQIAKDDPVTGAEQLFEAIAGLGGNDETVLVMRGIGDRLRSIRRQKAAHFPGRQAELSGMVTAWETGDIGILRQLIADYHRKRMAVVPQIVAQAYQERPALAKSTR